MAIFVPTIEALERMGVRYVVVGGLAVVLHGHARLTADIDLVVDLAPDQARRAVEALSAIGLRPTVPVDPAGFADPETRARWIREKHMTVFSMFDPGDPLRQVDLFVEPPMDFEDLWMRSQLVDVGGAMVRIASIEDLIAMKTDAGRPQDLADVEALHRIATEEGDG